MRRALLLAKIETCFGRSCKNNWVLGMPWACRRRGTMGNLWLWMCIIITVLCTLQIFPDRTSCVFQFFCIEKNFVFASVLPWCRFKGNGSRAEDSSSIYALGLKQLCAVSHLVDAPGRVFSGVGACPMARSLNVDGVFDGWQVWKKSCLAETIHQPVNFGQGSYYIYYALCRKPDTYTI